MYQKFIYNSGEWIAENEKTPFDPNDASISETIQGYKIVCCYNVLKTDHIGADFGALSKEHNCSARVIDIPRDQYLDPSLSDWVQLFGRVRSNTATKETATQSDKFPLVFTDVSKPDKDYIKTLLEKEVEYVKAEIDHINNNKIPKEITDKTGRKYQEITKAIKTLKDAIANDDLNTSDVKTAMITLSKKLG